MIKHKIERYSGKQIYKEEVHINKELAHRIKRCLAVDNIEDMTDEELEAWGYKRDSREGIFSVKFQNGSYLTWDLCSGTHNYYDDVTMFFPDKTFSELDCTYEFDDIEVDTDVATYIVKLVVK